MRLGTLLLRNAAISLTQLEAGLRAQVLYGGRLGTNLIELGFLDVDGLGAYLGELSGLPVASQGMLEMVPAPILALVPGDIADLHGAVPLYLDPSGVLAVAMIDPTDELARAELAEHTGYPLLPHVVAELRLLYYLEKHYGVVRKARYIRPGTRRTLVQADERRRSQPAGGLVLPPQVRVEPRRRRASVDVPVVDPPGDDAATPGDSAPAAMAPPIIPYQAICDRIDGASHRDQIALALVDFAPGRFEALLVFLIRDGNALGWRGHVGTTRGLTAPLDQLSLPLGGTSALQAAHDTLRPFRGRSPVGARPVETHLWTAIGAEPPPEQILVTPIIVKQRVVNLVYAHAPGGTTLPDNATDELCELAIRASTAYVRLIRQSKHAVTVV
jgi:MshEN domain